MAISMVVIPIMARLAPRLGMIDRPDSRKVHTTPIPRVGGGGIVLGALVPIAFSISPIWLNQKLVGVISIFRDITEKKQIDQAKSEFVSLASHQLRTPLAAVQLYLDSLLAGDKGEFNAGQRDYLQEIYRATQRMLELVQVLLHVSRI